MAAQVENLVKNLMELVFTIAPGSTIPSQEELARRYNVSRTSMREAISKLEYCNILQPRPKVGTITTPRKQWRIINADMVGWMLIEPPVNFLVSTLDLICTLGPEVAKTAYINANSGMFKKKVFDDTLDGMAEFHSWVFQTSPNPYYRGFAPIVKTFFTRIQPWQWGKEPDLELYLKMKAAILETAGFMSEEAVLFYEEKLNDMYKRLRAELIFTTTVWMSSENRE